MELEQALKELKNSPEEKWHGILNKMATYYFTRGMDASRNAVDRAWSVINKIENVSEN